MSEHDVCGDTYEPDACCDIVAVKSRQMIVRELRDLKHRLRLIGELVGLSGNGFGWNTHLRLIEKIIEESELA